MTRIFAGLGKAIHKHAKLCLILIALITIGFAFGLGKIQMNTGYEMFVGSNSKIAKDSKIYQKNFGNDVFIANISANKGQKIISSETFKKIAAFTKDANKIKGIKSTTSVVNMLNAQLKSNNAAGFNNSADPGKMQNELLKQLSGKQQSQLQGQVAASLNQAQRQKIGQYALSILTDQQKAQIAKAQLQRGSKFSTPELVQMVVSLLTAQQKQQIKGYAMTTLTGQQKAKMTQTAISMLPPVQNMSNNLIHTMLFSDNGKIPNQLQQLLPQNGKHLLISMTTTANSDMNLNQAQTKQLNNLLKKHGLQNDGYSAKLAGAPAIAGSVKAQMTKSMVIMLAAAIVIMIVILLIVFPVRRRLLPLFVVLIGMIWTFGFMGWLGVDLTMATMAVLPILIGLGTDFGVQFINRYEEEFRKNSFNLEGAVEQTAAHSGSAVAIATFVMILSFLTMRISKAPMLKDFGLTLAFGVLVCYLVETVTIFAYLSLRDAKTTKVSFKEKDLGRSWLNRKLGLFAGWIMKHAGIVLIIGIVLGGVGFFFEHQVKLETSLFKMIPQNLPALQQNKKLDKLVGSTTNLTYLVHSDDVRSKSTLEKIDDFANKEQSKYNQQILSATTVTDSLPKNQLKGPQKNINLSLDKMPQVMKNTLVSANYKYATISFKLKPNLNSEKSLQLMNQISSDAKNLPSSVQISPAGTQAMLSEGIHNLSTNRSTIMIVGLVIIFVVLLLIYRHWHYAIYPLLPIAIVLGLSPLTLKLLGISYNPVTISLSSLVLGIGTEFTILVLERYIEERRYGQKNEGAITTALSSVGQAITASGLTVVAGFSTLLFVSFPVLKDFGLITVLDTAYSLIATLTILPAIIYLLKPRSKD